MALPQTNTDVVSQQGQLRSQNELYPSQWNTDLEQDSDFWREIARELGYEGALNEGEGTSLQINRLVSCCTLQDILSTLVILLILNCDFTASPMYILTSLSKGADFFRKEHFASVQGQHQQGQPTLFSSPGVWARDANRASALQHSSQPPGPVPGQQGAMQANKQGVHPTFLELSDRRIQLQAYIAKKEAAAMALSNNRTSVEQGSFLTQMQALAADVKHKKELLSKVVKALNSMTSLPLDKVKFEESYFAFCRNRPNMQDERLMRVDNRTIDLHALHRNVLLEGGTTKASASMQPCNHIRANQC
jgi:hypothetical protein